MRLRRLHEAFSGCLPTRARRLPVAEHERLMGCARRERHGGLSVLYLAGSHYQMGYQQGVLARDLIQGYRTAAYDYILPQLPVPRRLARPMLFYHTSAYWPTIPAELRHEMLGIAEGAAVHPVEVLVGTAVWEVFLVSGCSEFAARGPVTTDGSLLHGYNYDLMRPEHALIQPYLAVLFFRPEQGTPFMTVNTVGSVGANAGMNEAGISVAWDNTYLRDDQLVRGIPSTCVPFMVTLRRLLQHAHNLDEAIGIVTSTLPRPLADIIIIGSATENRAVALETAGHVFALREMDASAVWSANCFRSPELAPHDRRGDGRALPADLAWERFPRYCAYRDLFATHLGWLTPETAASLLRDPYPREKEGALHPVALPRAAICRDITAWSLIMQPSRGLLWVSDTELPGCQGPFYAFSLAEWKSMADLNIRPTGYHAALRAAQRFVEADRPGAMSELAQAELCDGPSAPLALMRAVLYGLEGGQERARDSLRWILGRHPGTPIGDLAAAWLGGEVQDVPPIPFPSAIKPLLRLRPGQGWEDRAEVLRA